MNFPTTSVLANRSTYTNRSIVAIDPGVSDYQVLLAGLQPGTEAYVLDPIQDGIAQITQLLAHHPEATSLHLIAHGIPGCLFLGNTHLSLDTLEDYAPQLQQWFNVLPHSPFPTPYSLLLYGCHVAAGDAGAEFIAKLHQLTGANIAASTTAVGNEALGGNWELDATLGDRTPLQPFTAETLPSYAHVLSGLSFEWAKSGAGNGATDESYGLGVDSQGNVYTAGWFEGTVSFAPGSTLTSKGAHDIFISKRDSSGNLVWVKQIGGNFNFRDESVYGLQVDSAGNVYTTGYFQDTVDFGGTVLTSGTNEYNVFVAKFDTNGNTVWARQLGGASLDVGQRITLDQEGYVYTTGYFGGTADFDPGAGTANLSSAGGTNLFTDADVFVSKLDANGNFVWAQGFGNTGSDRGYGITTDSTGNVYTTGVFSGTVNFDPGAGTANQSSAGNTDVFVSKLNSSGNLQWAKSFGGSGEDLGTSVISDRSGNVYVSGLFSNTINFDPSTGIAPLVSNGGQDAFLTKFDSNGNLLWAKSFGSSGDDIAYDLQLDSAGNIYATGNFANSVNFNPGGTPFVLNSQGDSDIFLAKFDGNGNFLWAGQMGGTGNDLGYRLSLDAADNVYTTGHFSSTANFNPTVPGAPTANLSSQGGYDPFVAKLTQQTVTLTAVDDTATESGIDIGTYRISRGNDSTGDLTVKLSLSSSTDLNPSDYTLTGGSISINGTTATVVIPNGQSFVDLTFTAIDDTQLEADESLTIELVGDSAYTLGLNTSSSVTIAANDPVSHFEFVQAYHLAPPPGPVTNLVSQGTLIVSFDGADLDGDGIIGDASFPNNPRQGFPEITNFVASFSGTYSYGVNTTYPFPLPPVFGSSNFSSRPDGIRFDPANLELSLFDYGPPEPSINAVIGNGVGFGSISIPSLKPSVGPTNWIGNGGSIQTVDNRPIVSIVEIDNTASESSGDTGTYRISRDSNTTGDLMVNLSLSSSTDLNPSDYTLTGGSISINGTTATLVIPNGQSFVDLTLTAVDDIQAEAAESLTLNLTNDAAYSLGSSTTGTVTIDANDFVVTNTHDSGEGSLRQAILNANASPGVNTIKFEGAEFTDAIPDVIVLTGGQLTLSDETTILGLGANMLSISGNHTSRVFEINSGVTATLNDLSIIDGYAANSEGGGILNAGNLTLSKSAIRNNKVDDAAGGGISNAGILQVSQSIFDGNSGNYSGGLYNAGTATILSSTFSNNTAGAGGAINNGVNLSLVKPVLNISNSTISGNTAIAAGGGIYNFGDLTITGSTITANTVTQYNPGEPDNSYGGGIFNRAPGTVTVSNSIVAGNSAPVSPIHSDVNNINYTRLNLGSPIGVFTSGGYNLVGQNGDAGGFATISTDIVLQGAINTVIQALANNGGLTQTHALVDGSPAMNAGNNALIPLGTTTDQRGTGFDRIRGGTVDIGAVESLAQSGSGGNQIFPIYQGEGSFTITHFTGVGTSNNLSRAIRAEADTIQFTGADLTADKMLLSQVGANLEITFAGVADTKVVLQNFSLENLDNLTRAASARVDLANILFNGQTIPQDSFDVVNASFTQSSLSHRNSVTFLNDLDNSVNGFNNSNDVINGQGGSDRLNGLSGDDWLRGGAGNDTLIGGRDNDTLTGGQGADYFSFGIGGDVQQFKALGVDTITDFNLLEGDKIVLGKGTFKTLTSPAGGALVASDFATVTSDLAAGSSSAKIVYNSSNGNLFYNPNGNASGFGVGGQFAQLSTAPQLNTSAFLAQV